MRVRPAAWLLALLLMMADASAEYSKCGMAGAKCSMDRDCCEAHACTEGEWGTTTDYTCRRIGEEPSSDQYLDRLQEFYEGLRGRLPAFTAPTRSELGATLRKWADREELLFHVLNQKYPKDEL